MEKLARKLAGRIAKTLDYDNEREQVIAYGLIAIIQTFMTVALVLAGGLIIKAPAEALIICFSVSTLRKYSGGAHVSFIELCTFTAVVYCILLAAVSKYFLAPRMDTYFMSALTAAVFALSFLIVYKLAPVDSPNKPIKTEKKKKRMRKGSFITLFIYLALSAVFLLLSLKNESCRAYGISLLFGISWQIFTLTKYGSYFLNGIDFGVSNIFGIQKGGEK